MTLTQTLIPILAALMFLAAMACALVRQIAAMRSGETDIQSRDIIWALSGGLGLLTAALIWGAV